MFNILANQIHRDDHIHMVIVVVGAADAVVYCYERAVVQDGVSEQVLFNSFED